jgi:cobalt-zinc-cadmium efflux system protein
VVAAAGLIVNLASMVILLPCGRADINIRSAAAHMATDTLSSAGVICAGVAMLKWRWYFLDPAVAIAISVVILSWALSLMRESAAVLLEFAPKHLKIDEMESAIKDVKGVLGVHDIHVWEITGRMYAMTAHVKVGDIRLSEGGTILAELCRVLNDRFDIAHSNIQLEC